MGWRFGLTVLLALVAVLGTFITAVAATGLHVPWGALIWASLVVLIVSVAAAFVKGRSQLIPVAFVDELGVDGVYDACLCDAQALAEACVLTRPSYGHQYVPAAIAEQWRLRNPKGFVVLLNASKKLSSCFGVLGLSDSFWGQFIAGRISDTQLTAEDVLPLMESKRAPRLYLSGVVVRDAGTYCGSKRARVMIWAMLTYIKRLYGLRDTRQLYALAVTPDSERLLENLGFQHACDRGVRVDRSYLFQFELTKESWTRLLERVGDLSRLCRCKF